MYSTFIKLTMVMVFCGDPESYDRFLQAQVRCWLAQQLASNIRMQNQAATCIQRTWKGYRTRVWYNSLRHMLIRIQVSIVEASRKGSRQSANSFLEVRAPSQTQHSTKEHSSCSFLSVCSNSPHASFNEKGPCCLPPFLLYSLKIL